MAQSVGQWSGSFFTCVPKRRSGTLLLWTVYRGRSITGEEIAFIRQLIADRPELSRWKLSRELCEAWQWKQANGALRDMVCRGLLLMLHRAGEIELPPVKRVVRNRIAERAAARVA